MPSPEQIRAAGAPAAIQAQSDDLGCHVPTCYVLDRKRRAGREEDYGDPGARHLLAFHPAAHAPKQHPSFQSSRIFFPFAFLGLDTGDTPRGLNWWRELRDQEAITRHGATAGLTSFVCALAFLALQTPIPFYHSPSTSTPSLLHFHSPV